MSIKKSQKIRRPEPAQDKPSTPGQVKRQRKEKLSKTAKIVLVAIGVLAMVLSVTTMACSGILSQGQSSEDYKLTGGVAATVNGVNITEDTVTKQVMSIRSSGGYDTDEAWAQYLVDNGTTPEALRESVINNYAQQLLITSAEKEYGITVSDDEVEEQWRAMVSSYGSEDSLVTTLGYMGYTEDTYKQTIKENLAQQKLREAVGPEDEPSDEDVVSYINENLDTYNNARRSSHILFKVSSDASEDEDAEVKAKAQEVLDKINAGEITFEDAAKEYSEDSSADNGGDVGWDKLSSFVSEYQEALSALDKGEVSGLVKSTYGYHIIMCTDLFSVDGSVSSIDDIPDDIVESVRSTVHTQQVSTAYNTWLADYTEKADIQINKMPAEVPYNVSLDGVEPSSSGSASAGE